MKIEAAVLYRGATELKLETLDLADPLPNEILVRIVATGICHTDLKAFSDASPVPKPIVLGHEGAGVVEKIGSMVEKVAEGDHVVLTYNSCGSCPCCATGTPSYCYEFGRRNFAGIRFDGTSALSKGGNAVFGNFFGQSSFATHAICTERNLVKVRRDAPLELLGPLGCGVQTGAGAIINVFQVRAGESVVVFGAGAVGLSAVMAARLVGAGKIIVVDRVAHRLQTALESGATHVVNGHDQGICEAITNIIKVGADFTLDTTSSVELMRLAVESLAPRGTCGIMASPGPGKDLAIEVAKLMSGGRRVVGIVEGESNPDILIPRLLDLQMEGRFPFDRLVHYFDLADINEAITATRNGSIIKPVVRP